MTIGQILHPVTRHSIIAGAVVTSLGVWLPAQAQQTASEPVIHEIVVTAQRREESQQRVPISITALDSRALEQRQVVNLQEVGGFSPNVRMTRSGTRPGGPIFIRGIGQNDALVSADPGVGVYVDGVYLGRMNGSQFDLLDIERVEVLRGPQGTLYGKNTIGGAISVVSKRPSDEFAAGGKASVGNYNERSAGAYLNVPLSSDVFLRTSASGTKRDGYTKNTLLGGEADDHETANGRLQLRYAPTDALDMQLSVDAYRVRDGQPGLRRVGPGPTLVEGGSDPFTGAYDLQGHADSDGVGIAGHVRWTTDDFTFVSISAYREIDEELITDLDGGPTPLVVQSSSFQQQQVSQEFQLLGESADERLNWIVGLYGFRERARYTETTDVFAGSLVLDFGTAPKNTSYAAFGQFDYRLTPRLTATAGLRYTYDEREMTLVNGTFVPPAIDKSWSKLTPRLSLAFQATDSLLAYATASQGFKSGQFNARASRLPEFRALEPETVWAYELGVKSRWLDDRLQLNGSAFFSDYKDIQLQTFVAQPNNIDFISSNAPRGEVRGVELELIAQPIRNLTLQATLGLVDAEFTDYHDVAGNDLAGRKFAQTPETTYSLAAQYSHDVGEGTLKFASGYDYRSRHFLDVTNHADLAQDGFGLLSGRVTYVTAFDRMEVSLYGKNLTDERYITAGYNLRALVGSGVAAFGAPRTYGVEVQFRFD